MRGAVVAKCENCGAALRVDGSSPAATCEYCGVTSVLQGGASGAPALRIESAPEVKNEYGGGIMVAVAFGLGGVACIGQALFGESLVPLAGAMMCFPLAGIGLYAYFKGRREAAELQWFRDHGRPARASVARITAGAQGHRAKLGLNVESPQGAGRPVDVVTVIPPLIVPRLTEGMKLPIIVHPGDGHRVEIQWHLV